MTTKIQNVEVIRRLPHKEYFQDSRGKHIPWSYATPNELLREGIIFYGRPEEQKTERDRFFDNWSDRDLKKHIFEELMRAPLHRCTLCETGHCFNQPCPDCAVKERQRRKDVANAAAARRAEERIKKAAEEQQNRQHQTDADNYGVWAHQRYTKSPSEFAIEFFFTDTDTDIDQAEKE